MQGSYNFYSKDFNLTIAASISVSPNGWTDQELGAAWLQSDFDPATRDKAAGRY